MPRTRQIRPRSVRSDTPEDGRALRHASEEEGNVDSSAPMEEDQDKHDVDMVNGEETKDALSDVPMSNDDATHDEQMNITMISEQVDDFTIGDAVKFIRENWPAGKIADLLPAKFWKEERVSYPIKEDKEWQLETLKTFMALSELTNHTRQREEMEKMLHEYWKLRYDGIASVEPGNTAEEREANLREDLENTLGELKAAHASADATKTKSKGKATEHDDSGDAGRRIKDRSPSSALRAGPARPLSKRPRPTTEDKDDSDGSAKPNAKRPRSSSAPNAPDEKKSTKPVVPETAKDLLKGIYRNWNITNLTDVAPKFSYRQGYQNDSAWASDILQLFYDLSCASVGNWNEVKRLLMQRIAERGLTRFAIESATEIMGDLAVQFRAQLKAHHEQQIAAKRADSKSFVAQILQKWGMSATQVIPDDMREQFTCEDRPYEWDINALEQLCKMADVAKSKVGLIPKKDLRKKLHEGYLKRLNKNPDKNETRELTLEDTQYVMAWLDKQPNEKLPAISTAASAPKAPTGATFTVTAPATNTTSQAPTIRPASGSVTPPAQKAQIPNAQRGGQTTLSSANPPPPLVPNTSRAPGGRIGYHLAQAEHNLDDAIHLRSIAEAELSLARSQRDMQTVRAFHSEGEQVIKEAQGAVDLAALKVEKAKKYVADLRWERVEMGRV
jgi:hypothetical protein